ncbi:MAG: inositol monophosphatase family protein [Fimbriimonadaceae bacterium]
MTPRLAKAIEIVVEAGVGTLDYFNKGVGVELKGDSSPVTAADKGAEALVRRRVAEMFPGEIVLGEEEGEFAGAGAGRASKMGSGEMILGEEEGQAEAGDTRWVVDPIDGTKSFVCGVPLYATLLSYEVEGRPVLGVVYFPALDELFYAERGGGAFWNHKPIRVQEQPEMNRCVVCSGSLNSLEKYGRFEGVMNLAKPMMAHRTWSDAYGHMLVASGRVQAMLDPVVSRWDVSAVIPIVEEAGGVCMKFDGSDVLDGGLPDHQLELISTVPGLKTAIMESF